MKIYNKSGLEIILSNGIVVPPKMTVKVRRGFDKQELANLIKDQKLVAYKDDGVDNKEIQYDSETVKKMMTPLTLHSNDKLECVDIEISPNNLLTALFENTISLMNNAGMKRLSVGYLKRNYYDIYKNIFSLLSSYENIINTNLGVSLAYEGESEVVDNVSSWTVLAETHIYQDGAFISQGESARCEICKRFHGKVNWEKYEFFQIRVNASVDMYLSIKINGIKLSEQFVPQGLSNIHVSTQNFVLSKVLDFALIFNAKSCVGDFVIDDIVGYWNIEYVNEGNFITLPYEQLFLDEFWFTSDNNGRVMTDISLDGGETWENFPYYRYKMWLNVATLDMANNNKIMCRFRLLKPNNILERPYIKRFYFLGRV